MVRPAPKPRNFAVQLAALASTAPTVIALPVVVFGFGKQYFEAAQPSCGSI
jgi:hypothetical protein